MNRPIVTAMGALLSVLGTPLTGNAAEPRATVVGGSWLNEVPCIFTSFDPDTGRVTCTGSSTWQGSWTGVTRFEARGVTDPKTGDLRATLTETFVGTYLADRSTGSLMFTESITVEGATGAVLIEGDIGGGSGDPTFRCSRGHVSFDGFSTPGGVLAFGGWRGVWNHGCR
jgi:hypothetical protein